MDHKGDQVGDSDRFSEKSITAQQNQHYWQSTDLSILSHTEDNALYFSRIPSTTNRTILVSHISKLFLSSGQANDCGSLGTQVL